ncbi:MAG: bifunctional diaminohydroxyphosphoribosylaminopyrimidine deaminase/5-amino-6-(5-phosphoribosylamino)uracil reductase RibD [Porticoccus sp.]|nr:bifunctional diaminohydroxyphosphoribosylaminopyrimidine deaminase/5-amino-6-(5-phosphoribosylamino)uracil reductase RibD [Porticoccus sp.]MBQ0808239.1 bifunctional diaminohydroxyphosphoribosylaminopyrimidine deaminase/5-amino-6-(5-phosphoribosylamino)uracil reductase RibD [Porticoccus sp.]
MARAMKLAARGQYTCMPNPAVGCVIVLNNSVVGEGWHQLAGEAHAEVNALQDAGELARGATVYVTLEPCRHFGRTPPCADALIEAGVARVVYGMSDPNPKVAGSGLEKLRQAGIAVEGPVLEVEAQQLNRGFIKRQQQGLPWVTVKLAMSLDGRTAMGSGESQWVTGSAARRDVQRLRAKSCAIVTGIGTVLHDDPSLTVRANELELDNAADIATRQPLRVVVDSQLKTPTDAKILSVEGLAFIATACDDSLTVPIEGAEVVCLAGDDGQVDLPSLLKVLADKECNRVLVEAGAELAGAFLQAGLVDEFVIYMAPKLLGSSARPLLSLPLDSMDQQVALDITDMRQVGDEIRITARPAG